MKKIVPFIASLIFLSPATHAVENSFYASVGLYRANYDVNGFKETDKGLFAVDFGYSASPFFAVEIGFQDFGEIGVPESSDIRAEIQSYQVSVLGYLPLCQNITGYVKVGLDYWEVEVSATTDLSALTLKDNGENLFYGVGAELMLDEQTSAFIEYQFHSDNELQTYGLGIKYHFNR